MNRILLTVDGAAKLRAELKRLKTKDRPKAIAAIEAARSHGDLSENAEYDAAREQQGFIEGRIAALDDQLARAEIIDPTRINAQGKIAFGCTVNLFDANADVEVTYQIVGDLEADIDCGQISLGSPIARALIGKEEGDEVEVDTPGGVRFFEVLSVRYV